ncbi:MAG TPA: LppX_LprAFG lipoprotein [Solirubrobacterales bacterium]|nr:LppX_LprAFG lipoprotein [Solirubrobacterales bacterium]
MEDQLKSAGVDGAAPRRRRGRWWVGAGLAVVLIAIVAIVLASGGGGGGGPLNAIAKAAEVTQREPGGHATIYSTVQSSTTPEGLTEIGSMIFDDSGRAEGTITVRGHKTGREEKVSAIANGTTSYVSSDSFDSIPEGKKWVEVDLSSAASDTGASTANGPKEGLKVLEGVEGAEKIGQEDIDGVPTTHYRGTFPAAEEVFGVKVDVSDPQVDVWIDGQERVRRMQVSLTTDVDGLEGSTATTEMAIDYVSFGRVPKIELPPADEVFNATSEVESNLQSATEGG